MKKHRALLLAFAIINISTSYAQQRIVLVEQFTNSGCPPCATNTPIITQYADNNPNTTVAIAYHTGFPYNDSMYYENSTESNARVAFYGVASVPYSVVDGNVFTGSSSTLVPNLNSIVGTRATISPNYSITSTGWTIAGNTLQGSFDFTSLAQSNINDSLRAFVVVIEKQVLKSSYAASPGNNSETVYKYVMRKMLPDQNGTTLLNRQLNGVDAIANSWSMQHIKSNAEVRVVAFVQNIVTKEIYQAVMSTPLITGIASTQTATSFSITPNPTSDNLLVSNSDVPMRSITIFDANGRNALTIPVNNNSTNSQVVPTSTLPAGIYLIVIQTENGEIVHQPFIKN